MTIPERIMDEARALYIENDPIMAIARAILAAEQRGAASSQPAVTDEMVDAGLMACSMTYFRKQGNVYHRCSIDTDDVRAILQSALYASPSPASDSTRGDPSRDIIKRIAHHLTGDVGASCCHKTGGYGDKVCPCQETAREIYEMVVADQQSALAGSDSTRVAALDEAERILWLISGRSSTDRLCRENGLLTGPSQILARTWLEKYSSRIGPGSLQFTDQKGDGHE